uniref:Uncharacterized protein n=1 Tax=Vitis vinifera TaxID=29760 RepID=A5BWS5_VITVI|nr:hypothetical protein VITISV_030707 [Vitis vinifera]
MGGRRSGGGSLTSERELYLLDSAVRVSLSYGESHWFKSNSSLLLLRLRLLPLALMVLHWPLIKVLGVLDMTTPPPSSSATVSRHHMITRSRDGKPKVFSATPRFLALQSDASLTCFSQASKPLERRVLTSREASKSRVVAAGERRLPGTGSEAIGQLFPRDREKDGSVRGCLAALAGYWEEERDPLDARSLRSEYRSEVLPPALELERAEEAGGSWAAGEEEKKSRLRDSICPWKTELELTGTQLTILSTVTGTGNATTSTGSQTGEGDFLPRN